MIHKIKGKLITKEKNKIILENNGIFYQIDIPQTVYRRLEDVGGTTELVIYHYFNITKNKGTPVFIGFIDELEKDFFENFISVSGVGPKAALRAFDKPIPFIARAIEDADIDFLVNLAGIGLQRAKRIVAYLQGKVGRFALIKEEAKEETKKDLIKKRAVEEAKQILKRLQYRPAEIDKMVKNAVSLNPDIKSAENLLNEIYRQNKNRSIS